MDLLSVSVIIPAYNEQKHLPHCLDALLNSTFHPFEMIVVSDGSTDNTAGVARDQGVTVMDGRERKGPAYARNRGVAASTGDILVFIDADVVVHRDTLSRIAAAFDRSPELQAVFGSYDANPHDRSPVSLYKNLLHHSVHQHGNRRATTFWAGCGAVRRTAFTHVGGFDEAYTHPSIEDIDFGNRLREAGMHCELHREILCQHRKHWSLPGLIRTDLCGRAIPWTHLMLRTGLRPTDLNFGWRHRSNAGIAGMMIVFPFMTRGTAALAVLSMLATAFILVNWPFLRFLKIRCGYPFLLYAVPLHLLYGLCCVAGFLVGLVAFAIRTTTKPSPVRRRGPT